MYRTKTKERIGPLKAEAGEIIESGEEINNLLNDYFLSVFTRENQDTIPTGEEVFQGEYNDQLRDLIITRQLVQKEIQKLKKKKSPGPDEIYPRVLKECKENWKKQGIREIKRKRRKKKEEKLEERKN